MWFIYQDQVHQNLLDAVHLSGSGSVENPDYVDPGSRLLLLLYFSARELELEDRQSRLQQELRERMAVDGSDMLNYHCYYYYYHYNNYWHCVQTT